MTAARSPSQWMIRKPDLKILRPIDQATLVNMIECGELSPQDEVCPSNGYWFALQEVDELRAHLGEIQLSGLFPKVSIETTSSTDTRPIMTSTLVNANTKAPIQNSNFSSPAAVVKPEVKFEEKPVSMDHPHRKMGIVIAVVMALIFISVLFWLWSQNF